jgi:thymidine kinase
MFSGKTEYVIHRLQRELWAGRRVRVFRATTLRSSAIADHVLASHDGSTIPATFVSRSDQILPLVSAATDIVAIDEIQFLDWGVAEVCQILAGRGVYVIASGLDMNFRGEPFGPVPLLMSLADQVRKLEAVCVVCGRRGSRSQRLMNGRLAAYSEPVILPGAQFYEPRCRHCHRVPGRD